MKAACGGNALIIEFLLTFHLIQVGERWYRRDETFCENCSCVICSFLSLGAGNDCHKSFPGESSALSSKHYAFLPFNEQLVVFIFFVRRFSYRSVELLNLNINPKQRQTENLNERPISEVPV